MIARLSRAFPALWCCLVLAGGAGAAVVTSVQVQPQQDVYNEDRVDIDCQYTGSPDSLVFDFGDGQRAVVAPDRLPVRHFYHYAGRYDLTITAWENGTASSLNQPDYLLVRQRPLPGQNMMFLHHSTGRYLIRDSGLRSILAAHDAQRGTDIRFWDHDYASGNSYTGIITPDSTVYPDWIYGPEANDIQPDGYWTIFVQAPAFRDSLYARHDVIICKNDHATGDIADDAQLAAYQSYYLAIRDTLDAHPEKLFVLMSGPPRLPENTTPAMADRARAFYDWLQSPAYMNGHPNIVFFDLFDLLAKPNDPADPERNTMRPEYRRPYGDDHPNEYANVSIGPIFADFLIRLVDPAWISQITAAPGAVPSPLHLGANRPNPFNPRTVIPFSLDRPGVVSLGVYDLAGRLVRQLVPPTLHPAGAYRTAWDGRDDAGHLMPSGTYVYRLTGRGVSRSRSMLLVR